MFNRSSPARRRVAAVLAAIITLQPAFAITHQYRIPLVYEKPVKPPAAKPTTQPPKPGTGNGEVDTGEDPEAARKPVLAVAPAVLQFESNPDFKPVSRSSLITNVGPVPTAVSGLDSSEHFAVSHNCPESLEVDATCTVTVTPTSAAPGAVRYMLGVVAPGAEDQKTIELSTVERSAATPYARLAPSEDLVFLGDLKPGESAQGSATITNQGTAPALLGGIISSKYFAITNNCPAELAPKASCTISAAFQAYDAKSYQHTLLLKNGAPDDEGTPLTFYASIKPNPTFKPALAFDTSMLTFGPLDVGTTASKKLVLTNRGTAPAELLEMTGTPDFDVSSSCPALLEVNESCNIVVTFNATKAGAAPSHLLVAQGQDEVRDDVVLSGQVNGGAQDGTPRPELVFDPASIVFGNVAVGQTVTSTAKLTNKGAVEATFNSLTLDVGTDAYSMKHTCGAALAPAASCDITVTFAPKYASSHPGRINASITNGGSALLTMSGLGQQAVLYVGPTKVDLGATMKLATTVTRSVYLSNGGNVPVTGLNLVNKNARLSVEPGDCTTVLEPNKGCSMSIRYAPEALGTFSGEFLVTSDNGGATPVTWSGMAVDIEAAPASLVFPTTRVGSSAPDQNIQLTNKGPATVPFDGIGIGDGRNYFGQSNNCDKSLAAGASCTIAVRFTPVNANMQNGSVDVAVRGTVMARVTLSGQGVLPQLALSPTAVRFADTNVGQTSPMQSVTINNPTTETASLTGVSISNGEVEFAQANDCGVQLSPGQSCTVNVQMTPATKEGSSGALSIVSSFGTQNVSLSGRGTEPAGGADEQITPPATTAGSGSAAPVSEYDSYTQYSINFLDTEVGKSSAVRNVKFTNRGDGPLTVQGLSIVKGTTDYGQTNNCGNTLAPGAYCTISILFSPSALGERLGGIALTSDGGNFFFNLKGKGIGAEGSWRADSSADYGVVAVNTTAVRSFTLTNFGTVAARAIETVVKGNNVRLTANTCGTPGAPVALGVGASCRASVEYAPTVSGELTATLETTGTLANGPVTMALKGSSPPPALAFDAAPDGKFGTITVGTDTSRTYYLRNTGKLNDTVASLSMDGSGFAVTGGSCKSGVVLAPGYPCTVIVTANPPAKGPYSEALRVNSTQGASTTLTFSADAIQSEYAISGSSTTTTAPTTDYGLLTAGSGTAARTYFLRDNQNIATVAAQNITVASDGSFKILRVMRMNERGEIISYCATDGTALTAPCATTAPGHSLGVEVQFNPKTVGAKTAVLRFTHNGAGGASETSLTGAGEFNPTAAWSTSGSSVAAPTEANRNYGTLTPGVMVDKSFYIRNVGTHGAQAVGLQLVGDTGQFKIMSVRKAYQAADGYFDGCAASSGVIASGGASMTPCLTDDVAGNGFKYPGMYVTIRYNPTTVGNYSVSVTPTTNNGTTLPAALVLKGGAQFNPTAAWSSSGSSLVAPTPAYLAMGTRTTGTMTDRIIHVRNVGTHGAQAVGFKLTGDTSHFKIVSIRKAYQAAEGYLDGCATSSGVIASGGASSSPCLADDIAAGGFNYPGIQLTIRYTPTSIGDHSVMIAQTTNNGTTIAEPITLTGSGQFNPTAAWSMDGSRLVAPTAAYLSYGTRSSGSTLDKSIYVRNVGTNGALAVGFKLSGDTSQFKVISVQKTYYAAAGYNSTCAPASQASADGTSFTSCGAEDVAGSSMYTAIVVNVRYSPNVTGNHTLTITPTTSNGTVLPEPITLTGTSEFNANAVWSSSPTSTVAPTPAYLAFGSKATGTTLDKVVYVRNTGTYGGQAVGFTLTGDTSHFKVVQVSRTSQLYAGYTEACSPAVSIAPGGASTTPCLAADAATSGMNYFGVQFTLRYAPTAPGNHTVTVTPTTNNGTKLPEALTFNGSAP